MHPHRIALVCSIALVSVGAITQACATTDPAVTTIANDAGPGPEAQSDVVAPMVDAEPDSGLITDGGSNIDPDAGDEDDAGPDASLCNAVVNGAAAINSTCTSNPFAFAGHALVAGTYHLTTVTALGSPTFCQNQFVPISFKGTMELTVTGNIATAQTAIKIGTNNTRHRTWKLDPGEANASPLTETQTCPSGDAAKVDYQTGLGTGGIQVLTLRRPYGNGYALYRYAKQ
jgi:hypothetical protein